MRVGGQIAAVEGGGGGGGAGGASDETRQVRHLPLALAQTFRGPRGGFAFEHHQLRVSQRCSPTSTINLTL